MTLSTNGIIPLIQLTSVPFEVALDNLAPRANINYILDRAVKPSEEVNARWENITAAEALGKILKERGLYLVKDPVTGVAEVTMTNNGAIANAEWVAQGTNFVVPLIQFQYVPVHVALTELARRDGTDIVIDADLAEQKAAEPQPTVSVRWENLKPRQAIAALCKNYHLAIVVDKASGRTVIKPQ